MLLVQKDVFAVVWQSGKLGYFWVINIVYYYLCNIMAGYGIFYHCKHKKFGLAKFLNIYDTFSKKSRQILGHFYDFCPKITNFWKISL